MLLALLEKILLHGQQLPLLFVTSFLFRCCYGSGIRCWFRHRCWLRRRLLKWLRTRLGVASLSLLLCLLLCIPAFFLLLVILLLLPAVRSCMVSPSTAFAVDGNFESRWWMFLHPLRASGTTGYRPSTTCDGGASPTARSAPRTGKSGCKQTRNATPSGVSHPRPRHEPSMRRPRAARWRHTRFHWPTCPSTQRQRAPSESRCRSPRRGGPQSQRNGPLCADKYYTSGAMLKHLAWHAVHAAAPVDDKEAAPDMLQGRARRSPWHAQYARRPPPQAAGHAEGEEAPRAAPGAGGAAQQGSIPAGLAPLAPLWAPLGAGSPHLMAPVKPDRVVRSRGRSGMGSNIAWDRRYNDSVD